MLTGFLQNSTFAGFCLIRLDYGFRFMLIMPFTLAFLQDMPRPVEKPRRHKRIIIYTSFSRISPLKSHACCWPKLFPLRWRLLMRYHIDAFMLMRASREVIWRLTCRPAFHMGAAGCARGQRPAMYAHYTKTRCAAGDAGDMRAHA